MSERIDLLDLWRGVAVAVMLAFHLCWDLSLFGRFPAEALRTPFAEAVIFFGGGSFILLSGTVLRWSSAPLRRGFLLLLCALAVTVVTALIGYPAVFGALHLIAVCMLLGGFFRARLQALPQGALALACVLLFAVTAVVTARVRVDLRWLYPLGLRAEGFYSADYWPLLPWGFLYLLGTPLSAWLERRRDGRLLRRKLPRALTFPGRRSLVIYLLHQPVLYGICRLAFGR